MPETRERLALPSGEYEVLDAADGERLRAGARRVVVDSRNRPAITPERAAALHRVRRYAWWNATLEFPAVPDEERQLNALVNWLVSFALVSAILMAPGLASNVTMLLRRYSIQITQPVSVSVAVISLLLLILLLQRIAAPLWGAKGDPALVLRRLLLVSLPTPVMAAIATLVRPSESIETLSLGFLTAQVILLGFLVIWFLYYYLAYSGQKETLRHLDNAGPRDALRACYELLRPAGTAAERRERLQEAAQYMASFRRSRHVPPGEESAEPSRWQAPGPAKAQTLSELAWDLSRITADVHVGNQEHEFEIGKIVILRAVDGGGVTGACALRVRGVAGLDAGAATVRRVVHRAHRLASFEDGWYLEEAPDALTPSDFAALRM